METRNTQSEIDFLEMFYYLKKKIWIIVAAFVVCAVLGAIYTTLFLDDTYTATTRLYVLNRSSDAYISSSDYSVSNYMINDCEVLLTGQNMTDEVINQLQLDMSTNQLKNKISVSAVDNTRVLQIKVVDTDPQRAADIANCIQRIASEQLKQILNVEAVNLVYEAKVPQEKSGPSLPLNTVLAALLGTILCVGILVIIYILDDTISSEEDVECHLGLSVLGVIPVSSELSYSKRASKTASKTGHKPVSQPRTAHK